MKYCLAMILMFPMGTAYAQELPAQHTVVPKGTLWDLAGYYYHDPYKWPHIAQANPPPKINDPHWIYPKQIVEIPLLETDLEAITAPPAPEVEAPEVPPMEEGAPPVAKIEGLEPVAD